MTRREAFIAIGFLVFPIFVIGLLATLALIIAILPRDDTRDFRRKLAGVIMWQWKKGSRLSALVHGWLWQRGNGH